MNGAFQAASVASEQEENLGRGWGEEKQIQKQELKEAMEQEVGKPKLLAASLGQVLIRSRKAQLRGSSLGLR